MSAWASWTNDDGVALNTIGAWDGILLWMVPELMLAEMIGGGADCVQGGRRSQCGQFVPQTVEDLRRENQNLKAAVEGITWPVVDRATMTEPHHQLWTQQCPVSRRRCGEVHMYLPANGNPLQPEIASSGLRLPSRTHPVFWHCMDIMMGALVLSGLLVTNAGTRHKPTLLSTLCTHLPF